MVTVFTASSQETVQNKQKLGYELLDWSQTIWKNIAVLKRVLQEKGNLGK